MPLDHGRWNYAVDNAVQKLRCAALPNRVPVVGVVRVVFGVPEEAAGKALTEYILFEKARRLHVIPRAAPAVGVDFGFAAIAQALSEWGIVQRMADGVEAAAVHHDGFEDAALGQLFQIEAAGAVVFFVGQNDT